MTQEQIKNPAIETPFSVKEISDCYNELVPIALNYPSLTADELLIKAIELARKYEQSLYFITDKICAIGAIAFM